MDMKIRPMTPDERKYTYDQSNQLNIQTQCVGRLRADFSEDEKTFFRSWTDHVWTLNTDEFRKELDAVIAALRFDKKYGEMLKSRESIARYCDTHPRGSFRDGISNYGFRVDAGEHAYLCRLNPSKDEYNLCCYCYVSKWLDLHIHEAQRGIRFITSGRRELFHIPDGDAIRIRFSNGNHADRQCRYIDDTHVEIGGDLYHIREFTERMEQAGSTLIPLRSSLPPHCHVFLESSNEIAVVGKGGGQYYQRTSFSGSKKETRAIADMLNIREGITKAQAAAMLAGATHGWAGPAADPASYDEQGRPIKPRRSDRADAR